MNDEETEPGEPWFQHQAAVTVQPGNSHQPGLVQSQQDEEHSTDTDEPDPILGHKIEGGGSRSRRSERYAHGDEDNGKARTVGEGIAQQLGTRNLLRLRRANACHVGQIDRDQGKYARGGDGEDPGNEGGEERNVRNHLATVPPTIFGRQRAPPKYGRDAGVREPVACGCGAGFAERGRCQNASSAFHRAIRRGTKRVIRQWSSFRTGTVMCSAILTVSIMTYGIEAREPRLKSGQAMHRPHYRERSHRTPAIVLQHRDFGEADRIYVLFTLEQGRTSAVARGVRKSGSKLGSHLDYFSELDLELARGRDLEVITGSTVMDQHPNLRTSLDAYGHAAHLVELVRDLTQEHQENPQVYRLLSASLSLLSDGVDPWHVARHFELRFLIATGYQPSILTCAQCRRELVAEPNAWSTELGGLLCRTADTQIGRQSCFRLTPRSTCGCWPGKGWPVSCG
jgi:DNA repair protein RecO (recombination protein O)